MNEAIIYIFTCIQTSKQTYYTFSFIAKRTLLALDILDG